MNQPNGRCDLHTHSQASDGMQSPAENVRLAKQKGCQRLQSRIMIRSPVWQRHSRQVWNVVSRL